MVYLSKFHLMRLPNLQQVRQMFLLQHSSAVCRNFRKLEVLVIQILSGKTDKSETARHNFTHINGQDSLLIVPIKIRLDETYQFAAGSANVSVTTFLSSLQKLLKNERPLDITF